MGHSYPSAAGKPHNPLLALVMLSTRALALPGLVCCWLDDRQRVV